MMSLWLHDCASGKIDLHFAAHELPITHYANACYEGWIPRDTLQTAFAQSCESLEQAKNKWGKARGPISATILTAKRIGWTWQSATEVTTDAGTKLDLMQDSPAFVLQHVTDAVRRTIAK